jgi:hypothetical protein
VGDEAGGQHGPGAPGLVPQAADLYGNRVPFPVLVRVKLGPVHTAVLYIRVVGVLNK